MVRASRVLNRQLMVALAVLRSVTKASTSLLRASSPESRFFRQERDRTLNFQEFFRSPQRPITDGTVDHPILGKS